MGFMNVLRRAEEQGRRAARWGMEQAIVSIDDAERAIRRRMRIYPQQIAAAKAAAEKRAAAAAATTSRPPDVPTEDSDPEDRIIA